MFWSMYTLHGVWEIQVGNSSYFETTFNLLGCTLLVVTWYCDAMGEGFMSSEVYMELRSWASPRATRTIILKHPEHNATTLDVIQDQKQLQQPWSTIINHYMAVHMHLCL